MTNNLTLYSLIWGFQDIDENTLIYPRIPENTLSTEDKTIPRICTSKFIDGCLTGIGVSHLGLNGLKKLIDQRNEPEVVNPYNLLLPFTILEFNVDKYSPDVWLPGKVSKYGVDDAFHSGDIWITQPVKPCEVSHKWLVDGDIEKTCLLHNGSKQIYYTVSNSQWSEVKRTPSKIFLRNILDVTKEWIIQEGWGSPDSHKKDNSLICDSLASKINSAENKREKINKNNTENNRNSSRFQNSKESSRERE